MPVADLVDQFGEAGGFSARKVAQALDILEAMVRGPTTVFVSFPASLVATGARGALTELVRREWVDCLITTCGTLDHEIGRGLGAYYAGEFEYDDAELEKLNISRLGNVLVPEESYGKAIEGFMQKLLREIYRKGTRSLSTKELCWAIGKKLGRRGSLLTWCYRNQVPIYIPAIFDGAVGYQVWSFWQEHKDFRIDEFRDEQELSDLVFGAKKTGALLIGGGVSKHHTIWWNQFRDGLDFAVGITTAVEYDGSLSGARVREGISWRKVKPKARQITVEGDATILLPILVAGLLDRLS